MKTQEEPVVTASAWSCRAQQSNFAEHHPAIRLELPQGHLPMASGFQGTRLEKLRGMVEVRLSSGQNLNHVLQIIVISILGGAINRLISSFIPLLMLI